MSTSSSGLAVLAERIGAQREDILKTWREAIKRDPGMTSGEALPRSQIYDHIPDVLARFERELRRASGFAVAPLESAGEQEAAAHGLQRWQQGYDLREVAREWGRLNRCVVQTLDECSADLAPEAAARARQVWAVLHGTCIEESTSQYFQLQQAEAAGHLNELEQALEEIRELEVQRAELWQQAAHDLRGNLAVVASATAGLTRPTTPGSARDRLLGILQKNVGSLHHLLDDVTSLARLQAGQEQRQLAQVDVARLLQELCEGLRGLADQRHLFLRFEGPATYEVEADAIKVRRIAQNLIMNAVKYTEHGGVTVTWGDAGAADPKRWALCVVDTGPGIHSRAAAPLADALQSATQGAAGVDPGSAMPVDATRLPSRARRMPPAQSGEGLGLSIAKRLCEVLDATAEMQTDSGARSGTAFRILIPRRYNA